MQDERHYDIAVIGDGLSGQAMALALAAAGARVWLGRGAPAPSPPPPAPDTHNDARSMALTPSSVAMLQQIGVCAKLPTRLAPLRHMRITDGQPPAPDMQAAGGLYFTAPPTDDKQDNVLAYVTCNRDLAVALQTCLKEAKTITHNVAHVADVAITAPHGRLTLADGDMVKADLLVACDGRASPLREKMNIDTYRYTYEQSALIANITHSDPHYDTAYQIFYAAGTLASLPMGSHGDGAHNSALIWVVRPAQAESLCKMEDALFIAALEKKLGGLLGDIKTVEARAHYPLQLSLARHYTRPHFVLAGEAAHVIHPLAGQGYNLTLRDAARLANGVYEARRLGLAINASPQLANYESARRLDAFAMGAFTHTLNMAFTRKQARTDIFAPLRRAALHWANYMPGLPATARRAADIGTDNFTHAQTMPADIPHPAPFAWPRL